MHLSLVFFETCDGVESNFAQITLEWIPLLENVRKDTIFPGETFLKLLEHTLMAH